MQPSFAFILCDNGLGHTRRGLAVVSQLRKLAPHASVTVFANPQRARFFGANVQPFITSTSVENFRTTNPDSCFWERRLPDLSSYNFVISDNLVEILEIRPDAVLMGSFLWHLILSDGDQKWLSRAHSLIRKYHPAMLGTGVFASQQLRDEVRFIDVGFIIDGQISEKINSIHKRKNILISCGKTGASSSETKILLNNILKQTKTVFETVFVEPDLFPENAPNWMVPADFTPKMYSTLAAAVIRPGVGTVSDVLAGGGRVFSFFEKGNIEMQYNAEVLQKLDLGELFESSSFAFFAAIDYYKSESSVQAHEHALKRLRFDGAESTARWLLEKTDGKEH